MVRLDVRSGHHQRPGHAESHDPRFDPNGSRVARPSPFSTGWRRTAFRRDSFNGAASTRTCNPRPIPTRSPPTMTRSARTPMSRRRTTGMRPSATATVAHTIDVSKNVGTGCTIGTCTWVPPWIPKMRTRRPPTAKGDDNNQTGGLSVSTTRMASRSRSMTPGTTVTYPGGGDPLGRGFGRSSTRPG